MRVHSTYTVRRLIPVSALGIGIVALSVLVTASSQHSARFVTASSATVSPSPEATATPAANVTVDGKPVKLDASGKAKVQSSDGSTVEINSTPTTSGLSSGSAGSTSSVNYHIETSNDGTNSSSLSSTSSVQVSGDGSSYSSRSSSTSVYGNGQSNISVETSN